MSGVEGPLIAGIFSLASAGITQAGSSANAKESRRQAESQFQQQRADAKKEAARQEQLQGQALAADRRAQERAARVAESSAANRRGRRAQVNPFATQATERASLLGGGLSAPQSTKKIQLGR